MKVKVFCNYPWQAIPGTMHDAWIHDEDKKVLYYLIAGHHCDLIPMIPDIDVSSEAELDQKSSQERWRSGDVRYGVIRDFVESHNVPPKITKAVSMIHQNRASPDIVGISKILVKTGVMS